MLNWLRRVLSKPEADEDRNDERALALEREIQTLRLDLEERERSLAGLKKELERKRNGESARVNEMAQSQIERLLADTAAPIAQLLTQAHLLEEEGKPVQAKDVIAVAKRLVRALEDHGLTLEGRAGETVSFDPDRHEPLSGSAALAPGQSATLRFTGIAYKGKLLRKGSVEGKRE